MKFQIQKLIGQGAFGRVYLADLLGEDEFSQKVVLKVAHDNGPEGLDLIARLRDEARMMARLRHPSIVRAMNLVRVTGQWTAVIDYVEGWDLKHLTQVQGAMPREIVFEIIAQAADALDYAHREGCVHRDIKPSNLMVDKFGHVKILDFGVAFDEGASYRSSQTAVGMVCGSGPWMSPESFYDEHARPARDIYALGLTMFGLLVGIEEPPFAGPKTQRMRKIHSWVWKTLEERGLGNIKPFIERMLAEDPEERLTAKQVADACAEVACGPRKLRAYLESLEMPVLGLTPDDMVGRTVEASGSFSAMHPMQDAPTEFMCVPDDHLIDELRETLEALGYQNPRFRVTGVVADIGESVMVHMSETRPRVGPGYRGDPKHFRKRLVVSMDGSLDHLAGTHNWNHHDEDSCALHTRISGILKRFGVTPKVPSEALPNNFRWAEGGGHPALIASRGFSASSQGNTVQFKKKTG